MVCSDHVQLSMNGSGGSLLARTGGAYGGTTAQASLPVMLRSTAFDKALLQVAGQESLPHTIWRPLPQQLQQAP